MKMSHLWLPLSLLLLADAAGGLKAAFRASLAIVLAVLAKVQFSIQINDLSDRKEDQEAGKKRWGSALSKSAAVLVAALFLTAGLAVVLLTARSLSTILAYSAAVLLAVAYSLKPLRFKERGVLGLLVYTLSAVSIYVLVPWTWLRAGFWPLIVLAAAVGSDKWVQIHFHQVVDYHADIKTETRTYAVQAGLGRARSSLKWASLLASFCLLGVAAAIVLLVGRALGRAVALLVLGAAVLAAVKVITAKSKDHPWAGPAVFTRELPWIYLGLSTFTFFVLPPVLFFFSARQDPRLWILAALSLFSLAGNSWQFLRYGSK
jgi:4-hydroxybenzoate polyprenyltransferase